MEAYAARPPSGRASSGLSTLTDSIHTVPHVVTSSPRSRTIPFPAWQMQSRGRAADQIVGQDQPEPAAYHVSFEASAPPAISSHTPPGNDA
jgi:hypothetical protein